MRLAGLVGAALTLARPALGAQVPDSASFRLMSGGDTVIDERVTRTANELRGEFADRVRGGRMTYEATLGPGGLVTRLAMRHYRSVSDTAGDRASFVIGGDSIIARMGRAAPAHLPGKAGVVAMINPSAAFIEQVIVRARALGGDGAVIPVFIVGAPEVIGATVTWVGQDSATLEYAGVTMRLAVTPDGRVLGGTVPAQRVRIVRGRWTTPIRAVARDYSAPPGAPYTAEDVVVRTPAGLRLTGTLTIPRGRVNGRAPAVVTITGSGPEDRDEEPPSLPGYRPFRELADTLGRRGIAVLRLDDRGMNGSDAGGRDATSVDFADDVRAGVAYLRTRPEIDGDRIALVGHSEGAIIAPMVAATDPRLRAIVLMAGTASPGREILRAQQRYAVDSMQRLAGAARDSALARAERATAAAASTPWMRFFLDDDPSVRARQVKTPVLILQGETDRQVPPSEADKLAAAFRAGGNTRITVRRFPETDHLFVADASGGFDYTKLRSLHVRREVLGSIADWLVARFR